MTKYRFMPFQGSRRSDATEGRGQKSELPHLGSYM